MRNQLYSPQSMSSRLPGNRCGHYELPKGKVGNYALFNTCHSRFSLFVLDDY